MDLERISEINGLWRRDAAGENYRGKTADWNRRHARVFPAGAGAVVVYSCGHLNNNTNNNKKYPRR